MKYRKLGKSIRELMRAQGCQCKFCIAQRQEDPAVHAAFVAKVAAEMGVPVASGPMRKLTEVTQDEFEKHMEPVHQEMRKYRGREVWGVWSE